MVAGTLKNVSVGSRLVPGGTKPFLRANCRIFGELWKGRRAGVIYVIVLTTISAGSRIATLGALAYGAQVLGNSNGLDLAGLHFTKVSAVVLLAIAMGLSSLAGTWSTYETERKMRSLGRWLNELAIDRTDRIIAQDPGLFAKKVFPKPPNLNVLLTQVPIHYGLNGVTLIRMINPVMLMTFAALMMLVRHPLVALGVAIISVAFVPIYVRKSLSIQQNAKGFYASGALAFGAGLAKRLALCTTQHGAAAPIPSQQRTSQEPFVQEFMDAYDHNLLANAVILMVVSLTSVFLLPILFLTLGLLYSYGYFTVSGMIAVIGSVVYLIASAKNVASQTTNLVRYYSQARIHLALVDAAEAALPDGEGSSTRKGKWPDSLLFEAHLSNQPYAQTATVPLGGQVMTSIPQPLNKLSLHAITGPLISAGVLSPQMCDHLLFAGSAYRFGEGTIKDHLCRGEVDDTTVARAIELCQQLGAINCFLDQPEQFDTTMSEDVWNRLDANARVALRTVPLMIAPTPKIVFLDAAIIQSLNPASIEGLLEAFSDSYLFITIPAGDRIPNIPVTLHCVISPDNTLGWGDRTWFDTAHPKRSLGGVGAGAMVLEGLF